MGKKRETKKDKETTQVASVARRGRGRGQATTPAATPHNSDSEHDSGSTNTPTNTAPAPILDPADDDTSVNTPAKKKGKAKGPNVDFTDEIGDTIFDEIEQRPVLWSTDKQYHHQKNIKRNEAWQSIRQVLQDRYPDTTTEIPDHFSRKYLCLSLISCLFINAQWVRPGVCSFLCNTKLIVCFYISKHCGSDQECGKFSFIANCWCPIFPQSVLFVPLPIGIVIWL